MIKKILIYTLFICFFLGLTFAQNDTYVNISKGLDGQPTSTVISNTSTSGIADTAKYIALMASAAIVSLIIFKLIQGAVLKGTFDNIYDQQKGKKIIQNAISSLLIFIFVNLLFTYINPDYGSWIFGVSSTTTIDKTQSSGDCSPIKPHLTSYSPQANNSNGNSTMEGGLQSSKPGLDGKSIVRTLEDFRTGKSTYVTLAGQDTTYKSTYIIPSITYINKNGQQYTLKNVTAYVHDTGNAFKTAGFGHFDVATDFNMSEKEINKEPFEADSLKGFIELNPKNCTQSSTGGGRSLYGQQDNSNRCVGVPKSELVQIGIKNDSGCVSGPIYLRKDMAEKFKEMQIAAKAAGYIIEPYVGYRTDEQQLCIWKQNGCQKTQSSCKTITAIPCSLGGNGSNHSAGTAVDLTTKSIDCPVKGVCRSKAFLWLLENGPKYGFNHDESKLKNGDNIHFSLSGN